MTGHASEPTASTPGSSPLVTVVIPTHGRPALLRETLATIIGQDYDGPMEILVVHDREDADGTLADLSVADRAVVAMVNSRTGGLCGARNTGLLASRGASSRAATTTTSGTPPRSAGRSSGSSPTPTCWRWAPASAC